MKKIKDKYLEHLSFNIFLKGSLYASMSNNKYGGIVLLDTKQLKQYRKIPNRII